MADSVLHIFEPIGKYHVRLVRDMEKNGPATLDVREHISGSDFHGYTRRGARLAGVEAMKSLRESLDLAIKMLETKVEVRS